MASTSGVRSRLRETLVLALAVLTLAGCGLTDGFASSPEPSRPLQPVGTLQPMTTLPAVDPASGLPVVALGALPPEAAATVALVEVGGPFPYRQDGATFQNREGLLPKRESGYYREYTVVTPGSADRGARRIVAGADGEMYWTADHYDSFAWIAR
jgi:ribonuclease T1